VTASVNDNPLGADALRRGSPVPERPLLVRSLVIAAIGDSHVDESV
jgi:hypothetical protein